MNPSKPNRKIVTATTNIITTAVTETRALLLVWLPLTTPTAQYLDSRPLNPVLLQTNSKKGILTHTTHTIIVELLNHVLQLLLLQAILPKLPRHAP